MIEMSVLFRCLFIIISASLVTSLLRTISIKYRKEFTQTKTKFYSTQPTKSTTEQTELKGFESFIRINPKSDRFSSRKFHHVEFYTGESISTSSRFRLGLGMELVSKSDLSTGNTQHASYFLESHDMRMLFTAPYSPFAVSSVVDDKSSSSSSSLANYQEQWLPNFNATLASYFITLHGLGVHAIAIEVDNVLLAYQSMITNGGKGILAPTKMLDHQGRGSADIAEVALYGDTVLRLINTDSFTGKFLPNFFDIADDKKKKPVNSFGITRFDHIVGNVWQLVPVAKYIQTMTGFHEFAEFIAEDVGTVDSGLNSVVLANNNEYILLPLNEPTYGTKRKSQIQTYLELFQGEGVQHLALFTNDIFHTLRQMRAMNELGIGFPFMDPPGESYYENTLERLDNVLSPLTMDQFALAKEYGVLIDRDDQGMLLQIFTKPIGDRPTVFLEIIQRLGCMEEKEEEQQLRQAPGCGGFGKGNFKDLFKSIEEYENTLGINELPTSSSSSSTETPTAA